MRKIAIYARYSSDMQNKRSCEDQDVLCREYIAKNDDFAGIPIESYHDAEISGRSTKNRPEMLRLIKDVEDGKIQIIISEALDRLSRDQEDTSRIHKVCEYHNVPIYTLYEGIVTKIHIGFKGTMNAMVLDEIAKRTRRGQEGNIRQGKAAGGLPYGYKVRQLNDQGVHERGLREIDPEQAKIVKRIFNEFCDGKTAAAIARDLNKDNILSARGGQWNTSTITGHKGRGNGILQNPIYKGEMQWNRNNFKRHPETGTRHARQNSEDEIVTKQMPDLAIIDEAQWDLAQKIREKRSRDQKSERDTHEKLPFKVIHSKCGASMNRCDEKYLICSIFKTKRTCDENRKMRIDAIIDAIYNHMTANKDMLMMDWDGMLSRKNYEYHQQREKDFEQGKLKELSWTPMVFDEMSKKLFLSKLEKAAKAPADLLSTVLASVEVDYDENGQIYVQEPIPDYDELAKLTQTQN